MRNNKEQNILNFISFLLFEEKSRFNFLNLNTKNEIFWENLLQVASTHLILPKLFDILKNNIKRFNPPIGLIDYLQKISEINHSRNLEIIEQLSVISDLFNQNQINYVFLKGSAMILDDEYNCVRSRMIGDIDILVESEHIVSAENILLKSGYAYYKKNTENFTKNIEGSRSRHIPRLVHSSYIAAVELHYETLRQNFNHLLPAKFFLKNRRLIKKKFFLPSKNNMWQHIILNWQINDKGYMYNSFSFRSVIDVIQYEPINVKSILVNEIKEIKHFYSLMSVFYKNYTDNNSVRKILFKFQNNYPFINKVIIRLMKILYLINIIMLRINLIKNSKTYRNRIKKNPVKFYKKIKHSFIVAFFNKNN